MIFDLNVYSGYGIGIIPSPDYPFVAMAKNVSREQAIIMGTTNDQVVTITGNVSNAIIASSQQ